MCFDLVGLFMLGTLCCFPTRDCRGDPRLRAHRLYRRSWQKHSRPCNRPMPAPSPRPAGLPLPTGLGLCPRHSLRRPPVAKDATPFDLATVAGLAFAVGLDFSLHVLLVLKVLAAVVYDLVRKQFPRHPQSVNPRTPLMRISSSIKSVVSSKQISAVMELTRSSHS